MKLLSKAAVCGLALLLTNQACAVAPYAGVSLGVAGIGDSNYDRHHDVATPYDASIRAGIDLTRYFGVEGQLGTSLGSDPVEYQGEEIDLSLSRFASIYGKLIAPLTDDISIFALAGYSKLKIKAESDFGSGSSSDSDVSYGIGALFRVNPRFSLAVDALVPYDKGSSAVINISAGVRVDLSTLPPAAK